MSQRRKSLKLKNAGFTLLELMVATLLFVVITGVVFAVHWNKAEGVAGDFFVKENEFVGQLDDAARRADARDAGTAAVEHRIHLAFVRGKVGALRSHPGRRSK